MDRAKYRLARPVINDKPSRVWYVLYRYRGREHRVSTRQTDRRAAERFLVQFSARLSEPPDSITVNYILDQYEHAKSDAKSIAKIRSHLRPVREAVGYRGLPGLGDYCSKNLARTWRAAGRSDGTIRTRLLYLRSALAWAEKTELIEQAPYIPAPQPGPPRERYLTRDEFRQLYAAAEEPHLRIFLALGVYTGLRNGAILSLTWSDIDIEAMLIRPRGGSPNKKRAIVRINTPLALALSTAWAVRDGPYVIHWNGKPIKSIKRAFHRAARVAGLQDIRIHDLRRTCASWLAINGVSMDRIGLILGDSPVIVAKHYAHLSPDYLKNEMEGLG